MCLAHYTQPRPCFGQLPKNCDIPWWREGLTQGENRVNRRVIMLGGYFFTAEKGWQYVCLFVDTSFRENHCYVHDQQWSPASAFSSFLRDAFKPSHFQFLSDKAATNFNCERSNMKRKSKCSTSFCNALQLWGLSSEGQAETLSSSHRFPERDSCQVQQKKMKRSILSQLAEYTESEWPATKQNVSEKSLEIT